MAYQVISQNNTTTTLADENGNVIRVPARVSLATSTDYTIKKVNNSTATLEDGNGNIIRDVPCVAVLVGGEGGGGGAVSSVNGQTGDVVITGNDVLPDQTGQSGKFLTTDGTDASWSNKPLVNMATGVQNSLTILGTPNNINNSANIGYGTSVTKQYSLAVGRILSVTGEAAYAFGTGAVSAKNGVLIGNGTVSAIGAIQISGKGGYTNSDANTFKVGNNNGNYELLSADGTIPEARLADTTNAAQGQVLALDSNLDAIWTTPSGSGLPDQTGNAGKFLTTDGSSASWSSSKKGDFELWRSGAAQSYALKLGINPSSSATSPDRGVRLAGGQNKLKILQWETGYNAALEADVVEPGTGSSKTLGTSSSNNSSWNNVYTKKINAGSGANDIIVPTVGGTMAVIQVNTTITLAAADWSSNTQTVNVTGMTATGVVMVSPDPTDQSAYTSAGIICSSQAAGTLTFTCSTTPSADLSVNVVML